MTEAKTVAFLDIAERSHPMTVLDAAVVVKPLALSDIADLALRFKPFRDLITRNPAFSLVELMGCGKHVVGGLIAAAIGHGGDAAYENKSASLPAGTQATLLLQLYELSFPEDIRGPFVDLAERLFNIKLRPEADPPEESSVTAPAATEK